MHDSERLGNMVYGFCALILLLLVVQWIVPARMPVVQAPEPEADCYGQPLLVDYEYNGGVNEPWACQVQCQDGVQRYLVYANGVSTQCEPVPGCNDMGEDSGVTCRAPAASTQLSTPAS